MRNLKKILALVLALVMSFSLMSVSSAAFTDKDAFTADYEEAVEVLTGLKVIKGYDNGSFQPKGYITRAEAAAIIYRVVTGDVKDELVDIYAGYGKFSDVAATNWAAGYIGYCANAEFIKGYSANTFGPQDNVTGYQMLAMLLRALGYGKNGEFTGPNWDINTARYAESLGLLDNVIAAHAALRLPATRELVCELVFSALTKTPMVTYTLLTGYQPITVVDDKNTFTKNDDVTYNWTLGYETFGLICTGDHVDAWGRPAVSWYKDNDRDITNYNNAAKYRVATFAQEPDAVYNSAEDECCIAEDLGVSTYAYIGEIYVNGRYNTVAAADYDDYFGADKVLTANDVKNMVGEQGRQVEFYWDAIDREYDVVMIDTFFAIVTDVTEVEYDKNNHIAEYAELYLTIFNNGEDGEGTTDDVVLVDVENWEYEKYDTLLVNAWTEDYDDESIDLDATQYTEASGYDDTDADDEYDVYVEIVGAPEVFKGAQSAFTNQPTHIVDDVEYDDAYQLVLDQADLETTAHLWFKDQFGNIIAIMDSLTDYSYGTISAIKWVDTNDLLSNGYAYATITNMDGEQNDFKVYSIDGVVLKGIEGDAETYPSTVSSTKQYNNTYCNVALYQIEETSKGLVLTSLTKLAAGAEIENGVAEIGAAEDDGFTVYGGKTTKYLIWTGSKYLTYTGIKAVPSLSTANTFWAGVVDADEPVAEYVFVKGASQDSDYTNITFYAHEDDNLKVKSVLYNGIYYYVITGGYVNGEQGNAIYVPAGDEARYTDNDMVMFILENSGSLLNLYTADDMVYYGEVVSVEAVEIESTETFAIYAGEAAHAYMDKDVLIAGGEDYDVDGAVVVSYKNKPLSWHLKNNDGFIFVVYDYSVKNNEKNATFVYVGSEAGASLFEVALAEYNEYAAKLAALIEEMDTLGITLAAVEEPEEPEAADFDTTVEYQIALVNYYTTMMNNALAEMTKLAETEAEDAIVEEETTDAADLTADGKVAIAVAIVDFIEAAVAKNEALAEKDAEDVTIAEMADVKAALEKATELKAQLDNTVVASNEDLKAAADYVTTEFNGVEAITDVELVNAAVEAVEIDAITITYVTDEDANVTLVNELSYAIAEDANIVALGDVYDKVEVVVSAVKVLDYNTAAVKDVTFTVTVKVYDENDELVATSTATEIVVKVTYKKK